jgi:ubiquinone/menaquinone biosynthesis C-methylase UbiE
MDKKKPYWNKINRKQSMSVGKKYFAKKQELDKLLEKLITPYIKGKKIKIIDVCCGIGYLFKLLNKISPDSEFLGVDLKDHLIKEAKKLYKKYSNIKFKVLDASCLSKYFNKEFDLCISWKTLSWTPYYEKILKEMVKVTKKHIFISSLFYDGDIDFITNVTEHRHNYNANYNVYSYPKFKRFCYSQGVKAIKAYNFEIGIDLPKPPKNRMGTYTIKLENGKRLQISGAVLMTWKIIRLDL